MALSYISQAAAESNSLILGTHAAGDLLLMFAFRDGATTAATVPAGWTSVGVNAGTACASVVAYRVATSSAEVSGTWTNATNLTCHVYRGQRFVGPPVINSGGQSGTGTSVSYSGITTMTDPGNSWVARFAGHTSIDTALESPPAGHTLRSDSVGAIAEVAGFDTNGAVSSSAFASVTVNGTSGNWITKTIEILAQPSSTIALDNTSSLPATTGSTTISWSHTITSNTNGILLVGIAYTGSSTTVSGVTYNGVAMTPTTTTYAITTSYFLAQYYLLLPATGTHNVAVTFSNSTTFAQGGGVSLTNVAQSAPEAVATTNAITAGTIGGSITTISDNAWIVDVIAMTSSASAFTAANIQAFNNADTTSSRVVAGQYGGPYTPAGSKTSNWTITPATTRTWGHIMAAIAPYSGVVTPPATTGQIKVWNGSAWVAKPVKVWNGSAWVIKPVKYWNGSAWVTTPY